MPPLHSVVVVAPELADVRLVTSVLPEAEFDVVVARDFLEAKSILAANPVDLVVTDLRLGEYNGLHLVLRAKAADPHLAAVVLSDLADRVLQEETEQLGACFVLKPVSAEELTAAISRTLHRRPGDSTPIRPPLERRRAERRTAAVAPSGGADRRVGERRRAPFGAVQLT